MTQNTAAPTAADLYGLPISQTCGGVTLTIILFPAHAAVNCWAGTTRVEAWTRTWASHRDAYLELRRAEHAFNTHGGPAGVDKRAEQLRFLIATQHSRPARMQDRAAIAQWDQELTSLETFADRALRQRARNDDRLHTNLSARAA